MKGLHEATARQSKPAQAASNVEHAARLLHQPAAAQSVKAHESVDAMASNEAENAPKERRRMYKLVVPALDSMIKDPPAAQDATPSKGTPYSPAGEFEVLASRKAGEPRKVRVPEAIDLLRKASQIGPEGDAALKDLLQVEIKNIGVKQQMALFADQLQRLSQIADAEQRSEAAKEALRALAEDNVALGW